MVVYISQYLAYTTVTQISSIICNLFLYIFFQLQRLTISPDGSYALTTSKSNTLKCWHVENSCKETFCIQLDVKVTQMTYTSGGKYAALLGEGYELTKVMVFKVKPN